MITVGFAVVQGRSMLPTLRPGDRLLVAYGATPRPGRLVLCTLPPAPDGVPRPLAVKRLRGVEHHGGTGPGWWVDSDNPAEGVDSRVVGPLSPDAILAAVLWRIPRWLPRRRPARRPSGSQPRARPNANDWR